MEKQKMTIHRALSELKLIDSKIEKQTNEILPTGVYQKGKLINGYFQESEFNASAEGKYKSVIDLIDRKNSIKSAIVQANGVTMVKVGENSMTIADAINFKAVIKFKKKLIDRLKALHQKAVADLNNNNAVVEQNCQRLLEAALGKDAVKAGKDDVEAIRKPYVDANEFHLFDPLKVDETVAKLEKEVGEFEVDVDAALSEINAVTFIEV